ncbi:MAG: hypothetical protein RL112_822 [Planctomycetota bacterium]
MVRSIVRHAAFAPLLAACLALLVGLVDLAKPLDRGMGGWQAAFFALAARQYEAHGAFEHRGHPSVAIHGALVSKDDLRRAPGGALVYANHPPMAPLLAWASTRALADEGWHLRAGIEGLQWMVRLPFLLLHALGAALLLALLRPATGEFGACLGTGIFCLLPVEVLYGSHPNFEHLALVPILLALRAAWRMAWRIGGEGACVAWMALAGCTTWMPLFFAPAIALVLATRLPWRAVARTTLACALACAAPLALHVALARGLGLEGGGALDRALELARPLELGALWSSLVDWHGPLAWLVVATPIAALGLHLVARREGRPATWHGAAARWTDAFAPGWALCLGALAYLLGFGRHALEDNQGIFQLAVAPGACALVAGLPRGLASLRDALGGRLPRAAHLAATAALAWFALESACELGFKAHWARAAVHDAGAPDVDSSRVPPAARPGLRALFLGELDAAAARMRWRAAGAHWTRPAPSALGPRCAEATRPGELVAVPPQVHSELSLAASAWRDLVVVELDEAARWLSSDEARAYLVPREEAALVERAAAILGGPAGTPSMAAWRRSRD